MYFRNNYYRFYNQIVFYYGHNVEKFPFSFIKFKFISFFPKKENTFVLEAFYLDN